MSDVIKILQATKTDIPQVISIVTPYYQKELMGLYPQAFYYGAEKKGNVLIAKAADEIVGFSIFRLMKRTSALKIIQIARKEGYSGVGKRIFSCLLEKARELNALSLIVEVRKINAKAIDFYKRMGMDKTGETDKNFILCMSIVIKPGPKIGYFSDETLTHLLKDKNCTDLRAAEVLHVSRATIARRRIKLGLGIKPKRPVDYYGMNPEQENRLHDLYKSGKNDYEVAKEMHMGRTRLMLWRQKNNIPSKSNKRGLSSSLCPSIMERLASGITLTDMGKELGVGRTSVARLLVRNGLKYTTNYRPRPSGISDYKLTPIQLSVLIGDMCGDGSIVSAGPHTAYYQCAHSIDQKSFVEWKYKIFLPLSCRIKDGKMTDKRTGKISDYVCMGTWSTKELGSWRERFYPSGHGNKVITPEIIECVDPLGLAVWFMGDGTRNRDNVHFSVGLGIDLPPIAEVLTNKFSMKFEARPYDREWHLHVCDAPKFFHIISKHMLPYFDYKNPFK